MRAFLLVAALGFYGCFSPDSPICSYACGDNGACPDDYECRSDTFCHLKGTTGDCPFPDASVPDFSSPVRDQSMPSDGLAPDMSIAPDLTSSTDDGSITD